MVAGARWSPEQLSEHLSRRDGTVAVSGAGQKGAAVPKGLRLSNERLDGSAEYLFQIKTAGLPTPEFEFRFHAVRQWRADFAWPEEKLIVEYEGGVHTGGRHTRGQGFENDIEKYNEATLLGYRVIRITYGTVKSGMALEMTERALRR